MRLNPRLAEAPKCLGDTYKHLNRWKEAIGMIYIYIYRERERERERERDNMYIYMYI